MPGCSDSGWKHPLASFTRWSPISGNRAPGQMAFQAERRETWVFLRVQALTLSLPSPHPHPRSGAPPPDGPVPAGGSLGSGPRAHPPHPGAAAAADSEELPPVPVTRRDAVQAVCPQRRSLHERPTAGRMRTLADGLLLQQRPGIVYNCRLNDFSLFFFFVPTFPGLLCDMI